ncbi:hypothetical protein [Actinacidiphila sp. bgisy144]|uniref:hypothetical protein n=1 Tax=Actinacidiphila sp. bgisy144 TaxID=3413791 RepID=UPI003EBF49EB
MEKITVWITASQAGRLSLLDRKRRIEEAATIHDLVNRGMDRRTARLEVARMRPGTWPSLSVVVCAAVRRRLADPDLVGPWAPLTEEEAGRMTLAGRWPGPRSEVRLQQRNYMFPDDLASALRTASWRVSERPLRELESRGLVGASLRLSPDQVRQRDDLALQLFSPARIVREALEAYGPQAQK